MKQRRRRPCRGKFIVIEGIDGAGSETQSKLLFNHLSKERKPVEKLTYPDYRTTIGKLIHRFLYGKYNFSPESQFLLYLIDFLKDKEKIENWLKQGKIVVSDRYFSSTIAYQCLKDFSLKNALKIADIFKLPRPDLIIYLKVSPQVSTEIKIKEKRKLDRHEKDKKFLKRVAQSYRRLVKNQIFSRWQVVDGEKAKSEVFGEVKKVVKKKLAI